MVRIASVPAPSAVPLHSAPETSVILPGARILSFRVFGGFLDGVALEFTDGLSCIIGTRGTGKTSSLELIRYTLDAMPENDPDNLARIESIVEKSLSGGRAEVTVETKEGIRYIFSRTFGEDPIVLTEEGKATQIAIKGNAFFRADVYSQNEIENIADRPASQLSLIDAFAVDRIAAINGEIGQLLHSLAENAGAIVPLQARIAALEEELRNLESVNQRIQSLAGALDTAPATAGKPGPSAGGDVNRAHGLKSLRDRERRAVEGMGQFLEEYSQQLEQQEQQIRLKAESMFGRELAFGTSGASGASGAGASGGPNEKLVGQIKQRLLESAAVVDAALAESRREIARCIEALGEAGDALFISHNDQEMQFRALLEQHKSAQAQATERSRLERDRNELLAKKSTRDGLQNQYQALCDKRAGMLRTLSALRDDRFAVRKLVATRISKTLDGTVRVTLEQSGDQENYRQLLYETLRNSRVKPSVVAPKLTDAFLPARLVGIVREGDTKTLMSQADLSADQARKVIEALSPAAALFDLETVDTSDRPKIELNDNGQYKDSRTVSTGQKCTTILPILMLDSDRPLLIDQPEDNLDNRFVCEGVVRSIERVKTRRQLIFVTHNPNIPMLADAERVLVLDSDGVSGRLLRSGDVEDCKTEILTLLDGGPAALRRRFERYGL